MKTRIINLLLILFVLNSFGKSYFAQTISDEEKQKILSALDGNDYYKKSDAVYNVSKYKLYDLVPKLEEIIWKNDRKIAFECLRSLGQLNYSNINSLAHQFIEAADTMRQLRPAYLDDLLKMKYDAACILVNHNDFSKVDLIFQFIEREKPKTVVNITFILKKIIQNVPDYAGKAKEELFREVSLLHDKRIENRLALRYLADTYGKETIPILLDVFKNHMEADNRMVALEKLGEMHYKGLEQLLKEQFFKDTSLTYDIVTVLLTNYDCPENYIFVKNNLDKIKFTKNVDYVKHLILRNYIVENPKDNISTISMVDTLLSYSNQSFRLGWLDNNTLSVSLNYLNEAKAFLSKNDLNNTANRIKFFRNNIDYEYKDSTNTTNNFLNKEGWRFLYRYAGYILNRLPSIPQSFILNLTATGNGTIEKSPSRTDYDSSTTVMLIAKPAAGYVFKEWTGDITGTNATISVVMNSNKNITAAFIPAPSGVTVKLINSSGALLTGGTLQYYEGAWKDAVNNNNGTFTVNTTKPTISLRMTYEYGSQTKQNVPTDTGDIIFQTVNTQVKLQDSNGNLMPVPMGDQGTVQYYAGAWRAFGTTSGGIASKELLPVNYSFRMTYAFGSNDKQQDLSNNPVVVFRTVNASVQLQDSQNRPINQGTVQYYSGAWREFGSISNGSVNKELLPNNYSFRMTYAYGSTDKQQDLNSNPVVVFKTVNVQVQLKNSLGNLIDAGTVQYYAGAWRIFGSTSSGTASKELLPGNYSFRMTYEYVSNDKQQDVGTNNVVSFQTVLSTIRVKDSQNNPINNAQVSYYSGAWRVIGSTVNGEITKELLPAEISFRAKLSTKQVDKKQNIGMNGVVEIGLP